MTYGHHFEDKNCVVCGARFNSYLPRQFCSDRCRKRLRRGPKCARCHHYASKHSIDCTARVGLAGRGKCLCPKYVPPAVSGAPAARGDTASGRSRGLR